MLRRFTRSLCLALVGLLTVATPSLGTTGWLDPTFSDDGYVRLEPIPDPGFPTSTGPLLVRDGPTGRIFLGRWIYVDGSSFEFRALTSSGAIATGFNGGEWKQRMGTGDFTDPLGMFPSADGGVMGALFASNEDDLQLSDFGPGGGVRRFRVVPMSVHSMAGTMEQLPGGSLRSCGQREQLVTNEGRLVGFTATFDPDPAVGADRIIALEDCNAIVDDAAGHLYLADERTVDGFNGSRILIELLRTTTSGTTDEAWATAGHAILERGGLQIGFPFPRPPFPGNPPAYGTGNPTIFALPDGSLLIAARVARIAPAGPWSAAVIKLTPEGELDPAFGTGGIKTMGPTDGQSRLLAMTVDGQGRPIVSVVYNHDGGPTRAYLARLTPIGRFDVGFGRNGLIQQTFGARGLDIDAAGRILTIAWDDKSVVVARRQN